MELETELSFPPIQLLIHSKTADLAGHVHCYDFSIHTAGDVYNKISLFHFTPLITHLHNCYFQLCDT